jgi:hypothetical protein
MADLYRCVRCDGCGKSHDLYDTSVIRHAPGGRFTFTCSATKLVLVISIPDSPEIVSVLPSGAIPMVWMGGSSGDGSS